MAEFFEPTFLVERPESQRFWVVRASGGHYVQHFRHAGLMAIAHLDHLKLQAGPIVGLSAEEVERGLKAADKERSQGSITSHARQAEAFCSAIQLNDLVVTLDSSYLSVGRVTGSAYFDPEPVVLRGFNDTEDKMHHKVRRQVSWGPLIRRTNVPVAMEMTLFAHQTVFNIDKFWASVYHLLYPCFSYKNRLYLSTNIQQQEELDNYSVSQLFGLLSGVEVMAKLVAADSGEWQQYPQNLPRLREQLDLSLSSKAEFMSPGTVWATLLLESSTIVWAAVIYLMLFGGDMKFFKTDGIIDTHTRQKMWALVLKLIESHDFKRVKSKLQVDVPRLETSALEVPEQTKRRTRRKAAVVVNSDASDSSSPPSAP